MAGGVERPGVLHSFQTSLQGLFLWGLGSESEGSTAHRPAFSFPSLWTLRNEPRLPSKSYGGRGGIWGFPSLCFSGDRMSKGMFIKRALKKGLGHFTTNREAVRALRQARKAERRSREHGFLASYEWRKLRMQVLKRDGARCVCCGATPRDGIRVNVDHIKPRKTHPHLALEIANLQVLCSACNHGKGNWDQTDWRSGQS